MATARTYQGTPRSLARLARALRAGELVAVPTETVYGLAGDATSAAACRRIFAAKRRPISDPLIVHLARLADLSRVAIASPAALKLARAFWPGPLTLVLPKTAAVPDAATAGLPSVAVRLPAHPLFRRLIRLAGVPLAAPSANPFGYVSPTTAEHVRESLGTRIRHILDGGPSRIGLESTIVDLRDPQKPVLLRPGAISAAEIGRVLGLTVRRAKPGKSAGAQVAPGLLKRHYSPRTPLTLHRRLSRARVQRGGPKDAWLFLAKPDWHRGPQGENGVHWLDRSGDLRRACRHLFARLRSLDRGGYRRLQAELPPAGGLGDALRDRLSRAAAS
jgi:L-threonylcarbamoyladenylate synthase